MQTLQNFPKHALQGNPKTRHYANPRKLSKTWKLITHVTMETLKTLSKLGYGILHELFQIKVVFSFPNPF